MNARAGAFLLSVDLELAWGSWTRKAIPLEVFAAGAEYARQLDELARELRMPFTWAVVGALYDVDIAEVAALPAGQTVDVLRPDLGPYAAPLPTCGDILRDVAAWLDSDLVLAVANSSAGHEIATHTYFHALPRTAVGLVNDVVACRKGLPGGGLRTIVFPRDEQGDLNILDSVGITHVRAPRTSWYAGSTGGRPDGFRRLAHTAAQASGLAAPLVSPRHEQRRVMVPTSAVLTIRSGTRRRIPRSVLRRRFLRPLERARITGGSYHLYTHPWNFAIPSSDAFELLAEICEEAVRMRDRGDLDVLRMRDLERHATPRQP